MAAEWDKSGTRPDQGTERKRRKGMTGLERSGGGGGNEFA